jgi:hypothetical protein
MEDGHCSRAFSPNDPNYNTYNPAIDEYNKQLAAAQKQDFINGTRNLVKNVSGITPRPFRRSPRGEATRRISARQMPAPDTDSQQGVLEKVLLCAIIKSPCFPTMELPVPSSARQPVASHRFEGSVALTRTGPQPRPGCVARASERRAAQFPAISSVRRGHLHLDLPFVPPTPHKSPIVARGLTPPMRTRLFGGRSTPFARQQGPSNLHSLY